MSARALLAWAEPAQPNTPEAENNAESSPRSFSELTNSRSRMMKQKIERPTLVARAQCGTSRLHRCDKHRASHPQASWVCDAGEMHHKATLSPPRIRKKKFTKSKKNEDWDKTRPESQMVHLYRCLRARKDLHCGHISDQEFASRVLESGRSLNIAEPFGAEFFQDFDVSSVRSMQPILRRCKRKRTLVGKAPRLYGTEEAVDV